MTKKEDIMSDETLKQMREDSATMKETVEDDAAKADEKKYITVTPEELLKMIDDAVEKKMPAIHGDSAVNLEKYNFSDEERKMIAYLKEEVEVTLFFDGKEYNDDVVVNVNGKAWQIQRGEPVKVPGYVKEVLDNSSVQDMRAAANRRYLEKKFETATESLS